MQFLPLLLTLSSVAVAREADDPALADYFTHAGDLYIDGVVELPLFACPGDRRDSCVQATLEDGSRYLFTVTPGYGAIVLDPGFSGAAGVELKEITLAKAPRTDDAFKREKLKEKVGELAELNLGEITLTNLAVFASETPNIDTKDQSSGGPASDGPDGDRYGGVIGLNHFPGLSWALLRSEGVLVLSTTGGLLGRVQATPLGSVYRPADLYSRGSVFQYRRSVPITVEGQVNGKSATIALSMRYLTGIHRDTVQDRQPDFKIGNVGYHTVPVQVGGLSLDTAAVEGGWAYWENDLGLMLGEDYLWSADWAWDAATEQVALAWATQDQRSSWTSTLMEELNKGLVPEADPETGETPPAPEGKALAALQSGLANGHDASSDVDAQLGALRQAVEADPESCSVHHELGNALLDYGQAVEAIASLQTAAGLWDGWDTTDDWEKDAWHFYIDDLEEGSLTARLKRSLTNTYKLQWRKNIEEGLMLYWIGGQMAEREHAELEPLVRIQSNSCAIVWGSLAAAYAATGDLEGVDKLYAERLDFDAGVALAAGNARMATGDVKGANEAYRQAQRMGSNYGAFGVALAQLELGDSQAALQNMSDLLWRRGGDIDWLRRYYLAQARINGAAAAADEMAARAKKWPENPALQLAAAEAGLHAGRDASGWVQKAIKSYEFELAGPVHSAEHKAQYSAALLLDGRVEQARSTAEVVLEGDPAQSTALTTLGMIAALEGDMDTAKVLMERARVAGIWDPAYAVMRVN
jgi:predicted Zn-dependent protease